MAGPAYKPLAVQTQGSLPGVFDTAAISFGDAQKAAEALQAQELANQINEINAQKQQQQFDQQNQLRDSLQQQFGPQEDGTTPEFDPNAALATAMRLAGQQGDLDTMLNVQRAQRTLSGDRELTDVEAMQLGVPLGTTLSVAKAMQRSRDLDLEKARFDDPLRIGNRTLDMTLKEQASTGTKVRAPTAGEISPFGAADAATNLLDNIAERYIPYIEENRGIRYAEAKLNPNSAMARYANDLRVAAKNVALSMEARVTDQDYQIIADAAETRDLDTMETLVDKNRRLKAYVENRIRTNLNALEGGGVNVTGLRNRKRIDYDGNEISDPITAGANSANPAAIMIPKAGGTSSGGVPRNPDGSVLTREQFMALKGQGG